LTPRDPHPVRPAAGDPGSLALARQPKEGGEPVFAEPWQAQAFALAVKLSEAGWFTWVEWATALAAEIKAADAEDTRTGRAPDDGTRYYRHWLAALEKLVAAKGLTAPADLRARRDEWEAAYRATPHGKPVELRAARHSGAQHQRE
jgi:nitrile hydratase accessory protein